MDGTVRRPLGSLLAAASASIALAGCQPVVLAPSGAVAEEVVAVDGVTGLSVGGGFVATVRQGEPAQLRVRADDNVLGHVDVDVTDERVSVGLNAWTVTGDATRELELVVGELADLEASGGARVRLEPGVAAQTFAARMSGGSRVRGHVTAAEVAVGGSGGARVELDGEADHVRARASGGSRMTLAGLRASRCEVNASGGARVDVACDDDLDVTASGGSQVRYEGEPTVTSELSGGARLIP